MVESQRMSGCLPLHGVDGLQQARDVNPVVEDCELDAGERVNNDSLGGHDVVLRMHPVRGPEKNTCNVVRRSEDLEDGNGAMLGSYSSVEGKGAVLSLGPHQDGGLHGSRTACAPFGVIL